MEGGYGFHWPTQKNGQHHGRKRPRDRKCEDLESSQNERVAYEKERTMLLQETQVAKTGMHSCRCVCLLLTCPVSPWCMNFFPLVDHYLHCICSSHILMSFHFICNTQRSLYLRALVLQILSFRISSHGSLNDWLHFFVWPLSKCHALSEIFTAN